MTISILPVVAAAVVEFVDSVAFVVAFDFASRFVSVVPCTPKILDHPDHAHHSYHSFAVLWALAST